MSDMIKEPEMTKEEYSKFKSRTFWLTVTWVSFVPISILLQYLIKTIALPIADIIQYAGLLTITYTGGNKLITTFKEMKK